VGEQHAPGSARPERGRGHLGTLCLPRTSRQSDRRAETQASRPGRRDVTDRTRGGTTTPNARRLTHRRRRRPGMPNRRQRADVPVQITDSPRAKARSLKMVVGPRRTGAACQRESWWVGRSFCLTRPFIEPGAQRPAVGQPSPSAATPPTSATRPRTAILAAVRATAGRCAPSRPGLSSRCRASAGAVHKPGAVPRHGPCRMLLG
jgi:hypothetical protein